MKSSSSDSSVQTSHTLLERVGGDDHDAWTTFTRLYGPLVYAWCRNLGLPPSDIEDVGQEVFCVVAVKLPTFDASRKKSGAFRSWLWGITRFEVLNHLRSSKRQPVAEGGSQHQSLIDRLEAHPGEPELPDGVTSQQVVLKSAVNLLKQQFDPRTWQAFWDSAVKGRPARDIGDELDMTAKAVRQAKFRVGKKLRVLLADDIDVILPEMTSSDQAAS